MRLTAVTIAGYPAGVTDFATVLAAAGAPEREQVLSLVERIADGIIDPGNGQFTAVQVVGHSDRQDLTTMTCDQRRASEIAAARDRAVSAWDWLRDAVTARLAESGIDAGDWWETAPSMTWAMVFAAAGMLQFDPPSMDQRPLNRRVVFLVSMFDAP